MEKATKKKSGFRKAALPVFAMLIASVLSLTTMTYAWFTTGKDASVGNFDMTISAGGGLEISATGNDNDWLSVLDIESLKTASSTLKSFVDEGKTLDPVSTNGAYDDDMILNFYKGQIESAAAGANLTQSTAAEEGWLQFDLYFRNASSKDLKINLTGTKIEAKATDSIADPEGHTAIRMAFVITGTKAAHASGAVTAKSEAGQATIYEPNAKEHTNPGVADYNAGKSTSSSRKEVFEYNALIGAYNADGGQPSISRYEIGEHSSVLQKANTQTEEGYSEGFFTLTKETITKVSVFMWIEGQDADCTNYIASNAFTTQLKFLAVDAE